MDGERQDKQVMVMDSSGVLHIGLYLGRGAVQQDTVDDHYSRRTAAGFLCSLEKRGRREA
ncbi:hypothetical protein D3C76_1630640 [compost metagenome]